MKKYAVYALLIAGTLFAVEISMRAAGSLLLKNRAAGPAAGGKGAEVVLCLGDSYTFGGHSPLKHTYPYLLQEELDKASPGKYKVINGGICEATSWRTLSEIDGELTEHNPSTVILLTGAANFFNPQPEGGSPGSARDFLRGLRIYKLLRITWINSRASALDKPAGRSGSDEFELPLIPVRHNAAILKLIWEKISNRNSDAAREECGKALLKSPGDINLLFSMATITFLAEEKKTAWDLMRKAIFAAENGLKTTPGDRKLLAAHAFLLRKYADMNISLYRFSDAVSLLLKGLRHGPVSDFDFYVLKQAYSLQSSHGAAWIHKTILAAAEENPELRGHPLLRDTLNYFANTKTREDGTGLRSERDIRKMIHRSRRHGADAIVLNYPFPYSLANKAIAKAAGAENIKFLDLTAKFSALTAGEGRDKYFQDTDHCTPEGNRVIAAAAAAEIISRGHRKAAPAQR